MVFAFTKTTATTKPKPAQRTDSDTSIVGETLKESSKFNNGKSVVTPKQTATGLTASQKKVKKLHTRAFIEKMRPQLPADYVRIMDGTFAEMSRVTPQLFITGCFGLTKENFDKNKITNIINSSYECPDIQIKGISYIRVLVDDDGVEDLTPHFDRVAANIDTEAKKGGRTVVHCVAGVSRSAALVIAYLIKYKKKSLRDAFSQLRKARKVVKPNQAFFEQLIRYEKRILRTNSTKMITIKRQGVSITVPDFWNDYPELIAEDIWCAQHADKSKSGNLPATAAGVIAAAKSK